jgi:hypothetical protein
MLDKDPSLTYAYWKIPIFDKGMSIMHDGPSAGSKYGLTARRGYGAWFGFEVSSAWYGVVRHRNRKNALRGPTT